jgi:hypothetical protein
LFAVEERTMSFWDKLKEQARDPEAYKARHSVGAQVRSAELRRKLESNPCILVRVYSDVHQYEAEAETLVKTDYGIEGQSERRGKVNVGRTVGKAVVFLPWGALRPSRKGDKITVSWVRR